MLQTLLIEVQCYLVYFACCHALEIKSNEVLRITETIITFLFCLQDKLEDNALLSMDKPIISVIGHCSLMYCSSILFLIRRLHVISGDERRGYTFHCMQVRHADIHWLLLESASYGVTLCKTIINITGEIYIVFCRVFNLMIIIHYTHYS